MDDVSASPITAHYSLGGLRERIERGLAQLGADPSIEVLGPVDEFHIGGRPATARLVAQLDLSATDHVLDIGSGLGGTARFLAATTGATVTGIDLTREYIDVATWLTSLVGLDELVSFRLESATDLSTPNDTYTAATMVHVGMNIADKATLCEQVARVLRPGGMFAVYDVMATAAGAAEDIAYPVPWAASAETSFVGTADEYRRHLGAAGFEIVATHDRTDAALVAFEQLANAAAADPPPLGLHLVMGPETSTRFANMVSALRAGLLAPTEIIARRLE